MRKKQSVIFVGSVVDKICCVVESRVLTLTPPGSPTKSFQFQKDDEQSLQRLKVARSVVLAGSTWLTVCLERV